MIALKMRSSGRKKAAHSTLKRIFLTHIQMIAIVMSLNVPWPSAVHDLLIGVSSVMSISSQSSSIQCSNGASVAEIFYGTLIVAVLLPVCMAGVAGIYWFACVPRCPALSCQKNIRIAGKLKTNPFSIVTGNEETGVNQITGGTARPSTLAARPAALFRKSTRDGFIATNVYFVYLIYPSIIRSSFEAFQCETVCDQFTYVLAIDETEVCYDARHQAMIFAVAVPALLVYLLILPVVSLFYLKLHQKEMQTNRKFIFRFGLIFSGYSNSKWFWEIFVILRKVVLILIVTFGRSNQSQLHFALGCLGIMLYLQELAKPFDDKHAFRKALDRVRKRRSSIVQEQRSHRVTSLQSKQLHLVEVTSLGVLCVMTWVAVFFTLAGSCDNADADGDCTFLSFVVIATNVLFILICGFFGCQKFGERNGIGKKLKSLKKRVSSGIKSRRTHSVDSPPPPQEASPGVEMAVSHNYRNDDAGEQGDRLPSEWSANPMQKRSDERV